MPKDKDKDILSLDLHKVSSNTKELSNRLKDLFDAVTEPGPQLNLNKDSSRCTKYKSLAGSIIATKILKHSDHNIKLLSGCCICGIFRALYPELPVGDDEAVVFYEAVVSLLRGLAIHDSTSPTGMNIFYILESLCKVKSCIVPVILAQSRGLDLVVKLFDALLSSVRPTHNDDVVALVADIIQTFLDKSTTVNQDMLDVLLQPLLPGPKVDNPLAYKLVCNILKNSEKSIQNAFVSFANSVLVGTGISAAKTSELSEHLYAILFEVHKYCPSSVEKVLPNICLQLQVDEEDIRLKATKLLALLFASSFADYGEESSRSFREFLGRFVDKSAAIRLEMVDACSAILSKKKVLRKYIEDAMVLRLRDADYEIRVRTVKAFIDIMLADLVSVRVAVFEELASRLTDKVFEIRKAVMVGLCKLYLRYVSSALLPLHSVEFGVETEVDLHVACGVSPDNWERLKAVPSSIVKCWGYEDFPTKHLVFQLVQECLLPKASKSSMESMSQDAGVDIEAKRSTGLVLMFSTFDEGSRQSLSAIMNFKTKVRIEIESFLLVRQQIAANRSSGADDALEQAALRKRMTNLAQLIPAHGPDKKTTLLDNLVKMKDKTIFQKLGSSVSAAVKVSELLSHKDDVKQRVDSKSALGEYVGAMFDCSSYLIANDGVMSALLTHLTSLIEHQNKVMTSRQEAPSSRRRKGQKDPHYFSSSDVDKASDNIRMAFDLLSLLSKHASMACCTLWRSYKDCLDAVLGRHKANVGSLSLNYDEKSNLQRLTQLIDLAVSCLSRQPYRMSASSSNASAIHSAVSLSKELLDISRTIEDPVITGNLADASSRCVVCLLENDSSPEYKDEVIKALLPTVKQLFAAPSNVADKVQTLNTLSIMSSLVKVPLPNATSVKSPKLSLVLSLLSPADYILRREAVVTFLTTRILCDSFINSDRVDGGDISRAVTVTVTAVRDIVGAGLRSYSSLLATESEVEILFPERYKHMNDKLKSQNSLFELVQTLFHTLNSDGGAFFDVTDIVNPKMEKFFVEIASSTLFDLLRLSRVNKRLSIPQWHRLAWTLLTDDLDIRRTVFDKCCVILQTHPMPPQFLAYLCLLANDEVLKSKAESVLMIAVRRLRSSYDELCGRALAEDKPELRLMVEEHIPEIILPYVMHLLSYHPEFPQSATIETDDDKRRVAHVVKSLKMVLRVLLESVDTQTENISFLLKQVTSIESKYEDKHDAENIGLQFVARITIKLLKECIKTTENVQIYPGDIYLPVGLYKAKDDMNVISPYREGMVDTPLINTLIESDTAIDNALHRLGKGIGKVQLKSTMRRSPGANVGKPSHAAAVSAVIKEGQSHKRKAFTEGSKIHSIVSRESRRSKRLQDEANTSKNYEEPDEDDEEMLLWEQRAAENSSRKDTYNSKHRADVKGDRRSRLTEAAAVAVVEDEMYMSVTDQGLGSKVVHTSNQSRPSSHGHDFDDMIDFTQPFPATVEAIMANKQQLRPTKEVEAKRRKRPLQEKSANLPTAVIDTSAKHTKSRDEADSSRTEDTHIITVKLHGAIDHDKGRVTVKSSSSTDNNNPVKRRKPLRA